MRVPLRVLAAAGALYLAAYAGLSLGGTYERRFPHDVWRARWCWAETREPGQPRPTTLVGKAFYPLILGDAALWHRTRAVIWDPL